MTTLSHPLDKIETFANFGYRQIGRLLMILSSTVAEDAEFQKNVNEIADHIEGLVRGGMSISAATKSLSSGFFRVDPSLLDAGRHQYEKRCNLVEEWDDTKGGSTLSTFDQQSWYGGPKSTDRFWPPLRTKLSSEIGDGVDDVDESSSRVISLGAAPGNQTIDTRGLVLGYVQSGKTTNFISVIAKAADLGYKMIIVLTGTTDNLRRQTQARVDEYLSVPNHAKVYRLTSEDSDFCETMSPNALLLNQDGLRLIAVVKKNPARLTRLNKWLKKASATTLAKCPILVIDDEADQASIDVGTSRQSTINRLIRELLSHPKAAYIAYTATPFANLLIDPTEKTDLYPRSFIVSLPRPDAYFGPEKIFGTLEAEEDGTPDDGLDIVRIISDEDAAIVRPPSRKTDFESWVAEVPRSLRTSILWFLLATTARRFRAQKIQHSSMLIHTSMRAAAHMETRDAVESELQQIRGAFQDSESEFMTEISELWHKETGTVEAELFENAPVTFAEVLEGLGHTLRSAKVVVDNYLSEDRLSYPKDDAQTAIVVGGNTLSRGLTLEGLISSYFVRASSAYDTLLQMGRWFGYRNGYQDLVRIWMTEELRTWFVALSTVEAEIREEIDVYAKEHKTPAQLPVRIRTHPQMSITSAAKMRSAVKATVSYSGTKVQTILFRSNDESWLRGNIAATERLVTNAHASGHHEDELPNKDLRGFQNIDSSLILDFLNRYKVHENARTISPKPIIKYIESQNKKGFLNKWNIVFMERSRGEASDLTLGLAKPLRLLQRSKLSMTGAETANLKAISSTWDRVADLDFEKTSIASGFGLKSDKEIRDHHLRTARKNRGLDKVGLMVIYPIDKDSEPNKRNSSDGAASNQGSSPAKGNTERVNLEAKDHLIGISLIFPTARDESDTVDYMTADLEPEYIEDLEQELKASDEFDETLALQQETHQP